MNVITIYLKLVTLVITYIQFMDKTKTVNEKSNYSISQISCRDQQVGSFHLNHCQTHHPTPVIHQTT